MIIKDSSANKCAVICSSYEILACILLNEDEFLNIKTKYVEEVQTRLRHLAKVEGNYEYHKR